MIPGKNFKESSEAALSQPTELNNEAGECAAGMSAFEAVWRERRVAFDLLVGDVSHEIAPTLMFLGCLAGEEGAGTLSPENRELIQMQIDRLQRTMRMMRRLILPPPAHEPVRLLDVLQRGQASVAHLLKEKRAALTWAGAETMTLRTDGPLFSLLVRDLLASAVRDAKPASVVDVQVAPPCDRTEGSIEVWRTPAENSQLLGRHAFYLERVMQGNMSDLGLPICYRVARTLGWELSVLNGADRAGWQLLIPATAFCAEPAR